MTFEDFKCKELMIFGTVWDAVNENGYSALERAFHAHDEEIAKLKEQIAKLEKRSCGDCVHKESENLSCYCGDCHPDNWSLREC